MECRRWAAGAGACPGTSLPITTQSNFQTSRYTTRLLPNGERYAVQVGETLDRLERDSQYVMGQPSDGASLDIAILPTFATRWLIPRLRRFQEMHPNITVHLAEKMDPFALGGSGFDAAIHFEHPAWAGMRTHRLMNEVLVPVCHPALLGSTDMRAGLDDLPRLHRRQNPDAWQLYAQETVSYSGVPIGADRDPGLRYVSTQIE